MAVQIVRGVLVEPDRFSRVGLARKNSARPFVVAGTHLGIPTRRIASPVEKQIQIGVIADPSPDCPAAKFPLFAGPGAYTKVFPSVARIKRMKFLADQAL